MRGVIELRVAKDRAGGVRPVSGPLRKSDRTQQAARVVIDSTGDGVPVVTVEPPRKTAETGDTGTSAAAEWRPTLLMQRVSETVAVSMEPLSQRVIVDRTTGKDKHLYDAIKVLLAEGYLEETSLGVRSIGPYAKATDPLSDTFSAPREAS